MYKLLLFSGLLICLLNTCIDPYQLHLSEYESLLVVDGLITDQDTPYTIELSRTFQDNNREPEMVRQAVVWVDIQGGGTIFFSEVQPGRYRTDPALFRGEAGKTYTLHIQLGNREYISDPCLMTPVPDIDTIYYLPDKQFSADGTEEQEGISIYVTPSGGTENCKYLRWGFEETWKIKVPYPVGYQYIGNGRVISIPVVNHVCWKHDVSSVVLTNAIPSAKKNEIIKQPVTFISPATSDRLTQQYSILVKQYSISKKEYDFWGNLKQVSEELGDIFGKQPYFIPGNIHSVNNESEKVLGFFQVSAVAEKRFYVTKAELIGLHLPAFNYYCDIIEVGPGDYNLPGSTSRVSFDKIYDQYTGRGYVFVYPLYNGLALEKLAFATPVCADCSLTADPVMPDFWKDLP